MPTSDSEHRQPDLLLAGELAAIHAAAFAGEGRPWSGSEFLALLGEPAVALRLAHSGHGGSFAAEGFALYRAVADEAEFLTLAVLPEARRAGLLAACEDGGRAAGAVRLFLEVAAGNLAARALYRRAGYRECGRRKGYYLRPDASRDDALVMEKAL